MDRSVNDYLSLAYAQSTNKARDSAAMAFARWCAKTERPFDGSEENLCEYVAYLANNNIKASSIKGYLASINTYFKLLGRPDCLLEKFMLKTVLRGIKRAQAHTPNGKRPLTPVELLMIRKVIDWSSSRDRTFWACLVIGFWTFLRGSNLVPKSATKFDVDRHLSSLNMSVAENVTFALKRTKTIQFNERMLILPLVAVPGSDLCPVQALLDMWALCPLQDSGPLFIFSDGRGVLKPLLHSKLNECTCLLTTWLDVQELIILFFLN